MPQRRRESRYIVAPVHKALLVLAYVAERRYEVSLTHVSRALKLPKTTTFRYLHTLVDAGFLSHAADRDRYAVGPYFRAIAKADISIDRIRQVARPVMQELVRELDETVNLAVPDGDSIVYVDMVLARRSPVIRARIGDSHPMHTTALGKAILAYLPGPMIASYLSMPLSERTGRTVLEQPAIGRQLNETRRRGYATEVGENEDGAMCVGVPIFDEVGHPVAALSMAAPLGSMPPTRVREVGKRLVTAVQFILGHSGEPDTPASQGSIAALRSSLPSTHTPRERAATFPAKARQHGH